ncbi:MAG: nuclear transport factor 2 family protein [Emticicia sp.]|nr:nuclear transport factor 2 family protein [Emticicia sp.]
MRTILILAFSLIIGQNTFAQSTKEIVETLERKRFAAQVSKDFDFLEKVFANDLSYTHSGGKLDSKQSYIQSIRDGKSVYDKIDVEEILVREYGKAAVVNGKIMITQPPVDGKSVMLHIKYVVVYNKNGKKGWQLNTWQSLKLPN